MSNRSLFEIDHDFFDRLHNDPQGFMDKLQKYLHSGSKEDAEPLRHYGLRWYGFLYHSARTWKEELCDG
jgi:hypothetical protein